MQIVEPHALRTKTLDRRLRSETLLRIHRRPQRFGLSAPVLVKRDAPQHREPAGIGDGARRRRLPGGLTILRYRHPLKAGDLPVGMLRVVNDILQAMGPMFALGESLGSDGKRFWMLPRALLVAHAFLASRPMPSLAQPLGDALSELTRESASLGQLLDDDVIVIARSTARRSLSTRLGIGSRLPAYCSAMGRVLLAGLAPDDMRSRVQGLHRPALTTRTVRSATPVIALVERCRDEGFATTAGELEIGVQSIAVPVVDRNAKVFSAMSMAVRMERMDMAEFTATFLPLLKRARDTLQTKLFPEGP